MIIICPNCQAQYEVAANTIGNAGRKVQCASCQTNWRAVAEPEPAPKPDPGQDDTMFSAQEEQVLDVAFEEEEQRLSEARESSLSKETAREDDEDDDNRGGLDPKKLEEHRRAMRRRRHLLTRNLPQARARRVAIMVVSIVLMTFVGGGLFLRENIVHGIPDLAGLYSAFGLQINVVGLEFREVQTVKSLRDGVVIMDVSAMLENVSGRQISVPPVLVSLVDEMGDTLYEWSVSPQVVAMRPGEWVEFKTELAAPPLDAVAVRLSFVDRNAVDGAQNS